MIGVIIIDMELLLGVAGAWFILCMAALFWNRYSLLTGFMFDGLLVGLAVMAAFIAVRMQDYFVVRIIFVAALILLAIISVFGLYILGGYFILNARKLLKKEGRRFSNMLTLIAGIGLLLYGVLTILTSVLKMPLWLSYIWAFFSTVLAVIFLHVVVYLTTMILCNLVPVRCNKDFVVVLGSGLIDGKAPPLLQKRVDKGISFVNRQLKKTGKQAVLIMSGGKGSDESQSEASAMLEYAVTAGGNPEFILKEEKSVNTRENIRFSKRLMEEELPGKKIRCAVVSNTFHVLRAGILARQMGMRVSAIGCQTARYYLPNAVIREYIAFLSLYKRRYILFLTLAIVLYAAMILLETYFAP